MLADFNLTALVTPSYKFINAFLHYKTALLWISTATSTLDEAERWRGGGHLFTSSPPAMASII